MDCFDKNYLNGVKYFINYISLYKDLIYLPIDLRRLIWEFVVHEVPAYPEIIYSHLERRGIYDYQILLKMEDETIETRKEYGSFEEYARLIFVIKIPE